MQHDGETAPQPTQAELKDAEFALEARIDDATRGVPLLQDKLAQFVTPDRRQSDGQQ